MAMSSRAERDMSMAAHATPSMVGPGAYVSTGGFCSKPAKPSYAGFSSSLARGGRGGAGGGGYGGAGNNGGPGPGAYDASSGLEKEPASWAGGNVKGSHGMASSAPRIAPIYPGSTPFSASECIYTPGPGTYAAKGSMDGASKQQQKHRSLAVTAERSYEYRRLATQARSISWGGGVGQDSGSRIGGSGNKPIPSVPRREQSYGYEDVTVQVPVAAASSNSSQQQMVLRSCKPLPKPGDTYTGVGHDTVGPSFYEPNVGYLRTRNAAQVAFSKDTKARDIREAFSIPKEDRPGPGTYDLKSTLAAPPKPPMQGLLGHNPSAADEKDMNPIGLSSFFASKSKRHGIMATGQGSSDEYDSSSNNNGGGNGMGRGGGLDLGKKSLRQSKYVPVEARSDAAFGSSAKGRASFLGGIGGSNWEENPGPGGYSAPKSDFDFVEPKRLTDDVVAFASSDLRPCMQKLRATQSAPGPGEYNVDAVNAMAQLAKKRTVGRNGVFGTTSRRFNPNKKRLPPELSGADIYAIELPISPSGSQGGGASGGDGGAGLAFGSDSRFHDQAGRGRHGNQGGSRLHSKPQPVYRSSLTRFRRKDQQQFNQAQQQGRGGGGYWVEQANNNNTTTTMSQNGGSKVEGPEWSERKPPPGSYVPEIADAIVGKKTEEPRTGWSNSTFQRFKDKEVMGQPVSDTPGPGRYQRMFEPNRKVVPRSRVDARAGFSSAHRFGGEEEGTGGGGRSGYTMPNTWVKKSYNITFTNKRINGNKGKRRD